MKVFLWIYIKSMIKVSHAYLGNQSVRPIDALYAIKILEWVKEGGGNI